MRRQKRAFAHQESHAQSLRLTRLGRSIVLLIATILSFATFGLLAVDQLYRPDTFVIDQLKIKGSFRYLKPQQIEAVVNQQALGNFFSIELDELKQRIENVPWVQTADVRREWPNTLLVSIQEQRPVMRWQQDRWVNSEGQVIELPEQTTLSESIVLSGNEKDSKQMLVRAYRWQPKLLKHSLELVKLNLSERQAYSMELRYALSSNTFKLQLGRNQVEQRLNRFLLLFEQQYRSTNEQLLRVDARYPDGLAIKSRPAKTLDSLAIVNSVTLRTR